MARKRSSTSASQLEEVVTPPSLAKNSRQPGAETNYSSTELSPAAVKTTPWKKAKSSHEATPRTTSLKNAKRTPSGAGNRRSSRLHTVGVTTSNTTANQEINRIVEDITSTDSEKEEHEQPVVEETRKEKDPVPESGETGEKSKEELAKLCEEQQKIMAEQQKNIAELKAEMSKNAFPNERPSDQRYKSLYIDSKKEVDALTKETHQLRMDIEYARGRSVGLGEAMVTMLVAVARSGFFGQPPQ